METREVIVKATARLLAEHGAPAVSTRMICAAAGITAPTLYHHFGGKTGLLDAVVDDGFARFLAAKKALLPTVDPVADLSTGWDEHVAFGMANPELYPLMFPAGQVDPPPAARQGFDALRELFVRIEDAGRLQPGFDPTLAASTLWAAVYGLTSLICNRGTDPGLSLMSATLRDAVVGALTTVAGPNDPT